MPALRALVLAYNAEWSLHGTEPCVLCGIAVAG